MNKITNTYTRVEQELLLVTFPKGWCSASQTLRIQNLRRDQKGKKEKQKNYQKLYLIQRSIAWELCWVGHKKQFFQVWKIPKFRADKNLGFQKKSKKTKEAEQSRAEDWRCFSLERTSDSEVREQKLCDRFWLTLSDLTLILASFFNFFSMTNLPYSYSSNPVWHSFLLRLYKFRSSKLLIKVICVITKIFLILC